MFLKGQDGPDGSRTSILFQRGPPEDEFEESETPPMSRPEGVTVAAGAATFEELAILFMVSIGKFPIREPSKGIVRLYRSIRSKCSLAMFWLSRESRRFRGREEGPERQ